MFLEMGIFFVPGKNCKVDCNNRLYLTFMYLILMLVFNFNYTCFFTLFVLGFVYSYCILKFFVFRYVQKSLFFILFSWFWNDR